MVNKVFCFWRKIKIYYENIQNQMFHNFQTLTKTKQDDIDIFQATCIIIWNHLATLSKEFKKRFQDLGSIGNYLLLIRNPWHLETTNITQLAALEYEYESLFDEFIKLKKWYKFRNYF